LELKDTRDLAQFIVKNYGDANKIIEIGVGAYPLVAKRLKRALPQTRVVVTDTNIEVLTCAKKIHPELDAVYDNLFKPRQNVYEGAELIYSIRPPFELVLEIVKLSLKIGCDVLIRPYSGEEGGYDYPKRHNWRLITHGKAIFYLLKNKKRSLHSGAVDE
jgi:hypothetical protein